MTDDTNPVSPALLDEPISNESDDDLGRTTYATSLAMLIHNMPSGSSARIGIYGEWGEGKTSVMRLMAAELERHGDLPVFFTPWTARNRDEAWGLLLSAIRRATKTLQLRYRVSRYSGMISRGALAVTAKFSKSAEVVDTAVGEHLANLAKKWESAERNRVLNEATKELGTRKMVIFVDDLDRTDSSLLRNLLMSFRDLFNLPNFYYVLGLSPQVIAEGLKGEGVSTLEDAERFLEKIVEYPTYLPKIKQVGIQRIIARAVASAPEALGAEPLSAVAEYLPSNPRRLKLFLRHMAALRSQLGRFASDEIDWPSLYITQLLRLEFPGPTRKLMMSETTLSALESRHYSDIIESTRSGSRSSHEEATPPLPEESLAPTEPDRRARFLELCSAVAQRGWERGHYGLRELLTLFDDPPLITGRELATFATEVHNLNERESVPDRLARFIAGDEGTSDEIRTSRARTSLKMLIEMRDAQLDAAIEEDNPEQMKEAVAAAQTILSVLEILITQMAVAQPDLLTAESWIQFVGHVRKWSRFQKDELFAAARLGERELLVRWAELLPSALALDIAEQMPEAEISGLDETPKEFKELERNIRESIEDQAAAIVVDGFRIPGRLEAYMGKPRRWHGKDLMFDPESAFHGPELRPRLVDLASLASENRDVQTNLLAYLRLLFYGATDRSESVSRHGSKALIADTPFLQLVWKAALAHPINVRTVGSLRASRNTLIAGGASPDAMPLPRWWQRLEETFFNATPKENLTSDES